MEVFRTSFRFNNEIYSEFKEYCKRERISQVGLIEKLIKRFLHEQKNL